MVVNIYILKHSSFVIEFDYGANFKGYWDNYRMILQLEEYFDSLKIVLEINK